MELQDVSHALAQRGGPLRYNQLRQEIMQHTQCSKRTAQLAIAQASQQGLIRQEAGQYHLPWGQATEHVPGLCPDVPAERDKLRSRLSGTTRPAETEAALQACNHAEG